LVIAANLRRNFRNFHCANQNGGFSSLRKAGRPPDMAMLLDVVPQPM
jgi:hypothetical protein